MGYTFPGERVDLGGGRGWLDRPHADSIFRIDRQIGHRLQITEAGRTWDEQNAHFQTFLRVGYPIALSPDTPSVHQQGGAIDSNEAQRILQIMDDHGWRRTVYRWVNGRWTLVEEWHFERFENLDNHRNEPAPAGGNATPIQQKEWYEMALDDQAKEDIRDVFRAVLNEPRGKDQNQTSANIAFITAQVKGEVEPERGDFQLANAIRSIATIKSWVGELYSYTRIKVHSVWARMRGRSPREGLRDEQLAELERVEPDEKP